MRQFKYLLTIMLILPSIVQLYAQERVELVVFAASSLTDAYLEIADEFEAQHPHVTIRFNFAGSSTLATQIIQGAPADIFASANDVQMQRVIHEGRITQSQSFTYNRLAIIVPAENRANIQSLDDLARQGLQLIVAAPNVPIRDYTDAMFNRLVENTKFDTHFHEQVTENIVSEEPNVRQIVAKIALGIGDVGIVYASDITPDIADSVHIIPISTDHNPLAMYPIGILPDTEQSEVAQQFVDFILSDEGQMILINWGFESAPSLSFGNTLCELCRICQFADYP